MRMQLVSGPSVEPVTLADAKTQCRVASSITTDDTYIAALIPIARRMVEQATHLRLITQTWDIFLDAWDTLPQQALAYFGAGGQTGITIYGDSLSKNLITLPHAPVQSVTWVKYYDTTGTQQTWDASNYIVSVGTPGRIAPKQNLFFPVVASQIDPINVRYVAGFGDDATSVPPEAVHAVKLLVAHLYEHRVAVDSETAEIMPGGIADLLASVGYGNNLFA
jgi:hypothetical protein